MIWLPVVGNYADVDVYASILAYEDLLNQRGKTAKAYIPSRPNYSVPEELRLPERENTVFDLQSGDQAIILDLSEPDVIHKLVSNDQILELIDHHPGYEEYWQKELDERAIIEKIGAVATSIFEWWGECWDYDKMSPEIAKLLFAAILDNTINFNAKITTGRDRMAAKKLAKIAGVDFDEFVKWYFSEVSQTILGDLEKSLLQDCKDVEIELSSGSTKLAFSQLLLWDVQAVLDQSDQIAEIMNREHKDWIVSVLCISERKNYILASSKLVGNYFAKLLDLEEQGSWLVTGGGYICAKRSSLC